MGRVAAALVDLSGTLHIEELAIPGAVEALDRLRSVVPVRFVTNTTKESRNALHQRLLSCGFKIEKSELFTSLAAARELVGARNLRPMLMLEPDAAEEFKDIDTSNPNAVVVGLAPSLFQYEVLNKAFKMVLNGAELIAVHKGKYYRQTDGLSLGPGPFVSAIEFSTGKEAIVVGKPSQRFFSMSLDPLRGQGVDESTTVMIGDDVNDDVLGALNAGMRAVLVKTGKYRDEQKIPEDRRNVAESFVEAVDLVVNCKLN